MFQCNKLCTAPLTDFVRKTASVGDPYNVGIDFVSSNTNKRASHFADKLGSTEDEKHPLIRQCQSPEI